MPLHRSSGPAPQVRDAVERDCPALAALVAQLGYEAREADLRETLRAYAQSPDRVLVAEDGSRVVAMLVLNVLQPFHQKRPWGRVSALVVDQAARRAGVGARLLGVASAYCASLGCSRIELTSAEHRAEAHRFYRRHGFEEKPKRFVKTLT